MIITGFLGFKNSSLDLYNKGKINNNNQMEDWFQLNYNKSLLIHKPLNIYKNHYSINKFNHIRYYSTKRTSIKALRPCSNIIINKKIESLKNCDDIIKNLKSGLPGGPATIPILKY